MSESDDTEEAKCMMTPWIGEHRWVFRDETFIITITEEGEPQYCGGGMDYFHRVQVAHPNLDKLSEFLTEALTYTRPIKSQQIKLFYSKSKGYWEHFNNMYVQPIDKVYVDESLKTGIVQHIDMFIKSKQRYIDFGRPYKQNFLFTGIPGSGKTSLVKAIAHKYERPVYVLNFTKGMSDESLVELMSEVKDNSIILMEDIDAFFMNRETKCDINVSFSALLNIMDGTMMKGNGSMIFLTANNSEHLDSALIRPGRIDRIIKFDYPKQQEIKEAFKDITENHDDQAFNEFAKKIKGVRLNMSAIVDYLFRYSDAYMENIDELLSQAQLRQEIENDKTEKLYV
jgi:chaperone BCS1